MLSADQAVELVEVLLGRGYAARVLFVPDARGDFAKVDVVERPGATTTRATYRGLVELAEERGLELRTAREPDAIVELRGPAGP